LPADFWSSTTVTGPPQAVGPDEAWSVAFEGGGGLLLGGKNGAGSVRAVRGGW
jgi:hypothetical protein